MDLAKQATIVDQIHDTLADLVGERLHVKANMGRSKIMESEGTLTQVHPQLFIMEVDRKRGRTVRQSYQYVDILTGMVELSRESVSLFQPILDELAAEKLPLKDDELGDESMVEAFIGAVNAGAEADDE